MALRYDRLMRFGVPAFFFSCYFLFLLFYIDPAVMYSSNGMDIHNYVAAMHAREAYQHAPAYRGPPFRHPYILELTPDYFRRIACAPGGWTQFAVTLCIYGCHYPVPGALAVTGLALFFCWILSLYIQGIGGARPFILRFFPPFFLLTICVWYELSYCAFLLPVAGALALAVFYQRFPPAGAMARSLFLSPLFWLAWYFLQWGSFCFLLFAVIHELFNREVRQTASIVIAALLNGVLLYVLDARFIPLELAIPWGRFTALSGLPLAVIGFFPLAVILLAAGGRLRPITTAAGKSTWAGAIVRMSLFVCGAVAAAVWLCKEPVNRDTRTIARTVYHTMNGRWEAILHEETGALFADFPEKTGRLREFMIHAVDHALCRTGRLGDRLFAFPQGGGGVDDPLLMLETTHIYGSVNWVMVQDLAMDLGVVNMAEKLAGEVMENMGPYPDITYRRVLVQIAKGNYEAAAVYLHKLECMPFYRAEARRLLGMLHNNDSFASEPRIAAMRASMDTVDYFLLTVNYGAIYKNLLKSNPGNKAAYDYLMTYYILMGWPEEVVDLAQKAPAFGYSTLPRYWEEALCIHKAAAKVHRSSSQASFPVFRRETAERLNEFVRAYSYTKNDSSAAANLAPAFGDSYYYYSIFRFSPGPRHELGIEASFFFWKAKAAHQRRT